MSDKSVQLILLGVDIFSASEADVARPCTSWVFLTRITTIYWPSSLSRTPANTAHTRFVLQRCSHVDLSHLFLFFQLLRTPPLIRVPVSRHSPLVDAITHTALPSGVCVSANVHVQLEHFRQRCAWREGEVSVGIYIPFLAEKHTVECVPIFICLLLQNVGGFYSDIVRKLCKLLDDQPLCEIRGGRKFFRAYNPHFKYCTWRLS